MGVDTWDAIHQKGQGNSNCMCIVMWLVHNLFTYRLLSRKVIESYKGYKPCPTYGLNTFLSFIHLLLPL